MKMLREERSELVQLLSSLLEQKGNSTRPEMYTNAIKQTRRKLLGIYRQVINHNTTKHSHVQDVSP